MTSATAHTRRRYPIFMNSERSNILHNFKHHQPPFDCTCIMCRALTSRSPHYRCQPTGCSPLPAKWVEPPPQGCQSKCNTTHWSRRAGHRLCMCTSQLSARRPFTANWHNVSSSLDTIITNTHWLGCKKIAKCAQQMTYMTIHLTNNVIMNDDHHLYPNKQPKYSINGL